jgi:hypothetical protein
METYGEFLLRQRAALLRYLDGIAPQGNEPDAKAFCASVLDEWHERYEVAGLEAADRVERAFWSTLYLLEEAVEYPGGRVPSSDLFNLKRLARAREMLRSCSELPEGWFCTRPDGT